MNYKGIVPVPAHTDINTGRSPLHQATVMGHFGTPGRLSRECSTPTNAKLASLIETMDVGPFRATGIETALEGLSAIFQDVKTKEPALYALLHNEGMLCCRAVRGANTFSNHSFGCALDLSVGGELDQYGSKTCHQGILSCYPYFHAHGWYWGAGFPGSRRDPMHFELSNELFLQLVAAGEV